MDQVISTWPWLGREKSGDFALKTGDVGFVFLDNVVEVMPFRLNFVVEVLSEHHWGGSFVHRGSGHVFHKMDVVLGTRGEFENRMKICR